jgi:hypothetical protein
MFGVLVGLWKGLAVGVAFGAAFSVGWGVGYWCAIFRLHDYPLNALLVLVARVISWGHPERRRFAWSLCPISWNEVIWLPLPGAADLLYKLLRHDREYGFAQVAFIAAERSLQWRVAVQALSQLALDDLQADSIRGLATVSECIRWSTTASVDLPDDLRVNLPGFDRVSQYLDQYLILSTLYRKRETLRRASEELENLRKGLVFGRSQFTAALLRIANAWAALLDAETKRLAAEAPAVRKLPNPFAFGSPVSDRDANLFTGRRDVVARIEENILGSTHPPALVLYGARRMGKSSILNQLSRLLGPEFAPAIIDCQNPAVTESERTLLRYLSQALVESLERKRITIQPLAPADLREEPYAAFDDWLRRVERNTPAPVRVLICVDEYELLGSAVASGWGDKFLNQVRHLMQHRPRFVWLFTGAHTFEELGPAWTSRFVNARRLRVSFLAREDLRPLLTRPEKVPGFDLTYDDGAVDALLDATNGQPFLTQAVAYELIQHLNEGDRKHVTRADIETAIDLALGSGSEYFANVWYDAREDGQAVLTALARGEPVPDAPRARRWLRDHDVLTDRGSFAVPMVRHWVERHLAEGR